MKNKHVLFLGLGANVGNKKKNLEEAIGKLKGQISNIKVSKFYETEPWGYKNQDKFLNAAISGETNLSPSELLKFIKKIEQDLGRVERFKWGPREIDIDILFYDDLVYEDDSLIIPHPLLQERKFVLDPLMDLDADYIHPVIRKPIWQLCKKLCI